MFHPTLFFPPRCFWCFFQMWTICHWLAETSVSEASSFYQLWKYDIYLSKFGQSFFFFFPWHEIFYNTFILSWLKSFLFLQHSVLSVFLLRGISLAYLLLLLFKRRKRFQLPVDKIRSEWQQPTILWKNLVFKFKCSWHQLSSYSFCLCGKKPSLFITACQMNNRMGGANLKDMADWCNWKGLYN